MRSAVKSANYGAVISNAPECPVYRGRVTRAGSRLLNDNWNLGSKDDHIVPPATTRHRR